MNRAQEIMAEALWVERNHGDPGPVFIAGRIGALALTGDIAGVERWKAIAAEFLRLQNGTEQ
jgi:hypothetical protein